MSFGEVIIGVTSIAGSPGPEAKELLNGFHEASRWGDGYYWIAGNRPEDGAAPEAGCMWVEVARESLMAIEFVVHRAVVLGVNQSFSDLVITQANGETRLLLGNPIQTGRVWAGEHREAESLVLQQNQECMFDIVDFTGRRIGAVLFRVGEVV